MTSPEFPGDLLDKMERYSLSVEGIRSSIDAYWLQGGDDFDEFMSQLDIGVGEDDISWSRRVFAGQWSAMQYERE